jgi:4-hydroxybenzoyl-CoA thioesterase
MFAEEIGVDFATMHGKRRLGVPTVKFDVEFVAPSRLGDLLGFGIDVMRVGRSSADLSVAVHAMASFAFVHRWCWSAWTSVPRDRAHGRPICAPAKCAPPPDVVGVAVPGREGAPPSP